jgi:nicotinamide-nucleotide amidase
VTAASEATWSDLRRAAEAVAGRLGARGETVAVAESSAGGLIAAALLAVPGASAYFRGGAVVYTGDAKERLLARPREVLTDPRAATEGHALVLARAVRERLDATWGIGETGAAGPTGNRYGDPPGHACVAVAGPPASGAGSGAGNERSTTVRTGHDGREGNMHAFTLAALRLLEAALR